MHTQILIEMGLGLCLTLSVVLWHIDALVVICEARICNLENRVRVNVGKVP